MHPHISGHRSRIGVLDRVIQHAKNKSACWFATHEQVAKWCKEQAG